MKKSLIVFALVLNTLAGQAQASQLKGKVVSIADGDTLTILQNDKTQKRIRLGEIDAPESKQAFGQRSKESLIQICGGRNAVVQVQDIDRYGRVVGRVSCNGVDANTEQLHRGMAWVYDSYAKDKSLYDVQSQAKKARKGLWADANPVAPWLWRKGQTTARAASQTGPKVGNGDVRGNKNSKVYHLSNCPGYTAMSPKNVQPFKTEKEARAAGFRKAGNCPK
ncbi:thermonuclease family protein [Advenella alkanexedens]|uniref:Thermonuclease family protein n=1 Tax=Advenella alkanexedens TaxID=1481665 RepID=A0ABS6NNR1_9BURK|nr:MULTISPECIES: thermonuclease family protein [Advenella]MBV4396821.1 thermonuclease family protein [Advenella alkanexedens]MDD3758683.1 thermonuclease family protein [Advenella sp.]